MTFFKAAECNNEIWTKVFYNNPVITSALYALGVLSSGWRDPQRPVFQWLLAAASYDDLLAIKMQKDYVGQSADFSKVRDAIEQAFLLALPTKIRFATIGPKAETAKQIVCELTETSLEKGFGDIISSYVTEDMIGNADADEACAEMEREMNQNNMEEGEGEHEE